MNYPILEPPFMARINWYLPHRPKEIISSIKSHNIYKSSSARKSKSTIQSTYNNMNKVRENTRQINANQAYKKMLNKRKKKKSKNK